MSADLDALDRGVIETGLEAAEALARVDALEEQIRALKHAVSRQVAALFDIMAQATAAVSGGDEMPSGYRAALEVQARRRAMHAVPAAGAKR